MRTNFTAGQDCDPIESLPLKANPPSDGELSYCNSQTYTNINIRKNRREKTSLISFLFYESINRRGVEQTHIGTVWDEI